MPPSPMSRPQSLLRNLVRTPALEAIVLPRKVFKKVTHVSSLDPVKVPDAALGGRNRRGWRERRRNRYKTVVRKTKRGRDSRSIVKWVSSKE